MLFPATGPDVSGGAGPGGHSYGNPAQACYLRVMRGSDGGAGGPLVFDARSCYGTNAPAARITPDNKAAADLVMHEYAVGHGLDGEIR
jgi:hypothetical protein